MILESGTATAYEDIATQRELPNESRREDVTFHKETALYR